MPTKRTRNHGPVVVVGYDGSPESRAAVDHAARQAGKSGRVYVVHACDDLARGEATVDALALTDDPILDTHFRTELLHCPPAEAIARVAAERGADEIVIGARGLGPFRSALGSVSQQVLHEARVPVVVIPPSALDEE